MEKNLITGTELARRLDLSARRLRELAQKKIAVRASLGRYDAEKSTINYIRHLREQAAGRAGIDAATDLASVNVRLKEANIRLANLRFKKESGMLIEKDIVLATWAPIMHTIVQRSLAYPAKFMFEIPSISATDRSRMEQIIRDDLEDMRLGHGFDFGSAASATELADAIRERDEGKNG
jgi:terminase small subunit / prophage DNA-packing protein